LGISRYPTLLVLRVDRGLELCVHGSRIWREIWVVEFSFRGIH